MTLGSCVLLSLLLLAMAGNCQGARILGLFPFPSKSHMISFSALMRELAARGHQLTVLTVFPESTPLANYTEIIMENTFPPRLSEEMFSRQGINPLPMVDFWWRESIVRCDAALQQSNVQKLIHATNLEFDLIIMEGLMHECFMGFIHKFKAPTIHMSITTAILWMGFLVGNPYPLSHTPELLLGYNEHMNFCERLVNTLFGTFVMVGRSLYYLPRQEAVMRKYFTDPDLPSLAELEAQAAYLLTNSHISFTFPRVLTPNTAEVGAMHIKPSKKLPKDLQTFLDDAPDGVVYFSMGSNLKSSVMPQEKRDAFLQAFAGLKQKVLWKWETDVLPGQPKNVRLEKWLPQSDILGHPNVKVFITHGGLLSTQEAVYHAVPILAIPIYADQRINALRAQNTGFGIKLDLKNVTTESITWALDDILNHPSYQTNVKRLSAIFHDQPETPLQRAVYWTEYVIRHKGAPLMRSAALDLTWYQYFLLDVVAFVVVVTLLSLTLLFLVCRVVFRKITCTKRVKRSNKTNQMPQNPSQEHLLHTNNNI